MHITLAERIEDLATRGVGEGSIADCRRQTMSNHPRSIALATGINAMHGLKQAALKASDAVVYEAALDIENQLHEQMGAFHPSNW